MTEPINTIPQETEPMNTAAQEAQPINTAPQKAGPSQVSAAPVRQLNTKRSLVKFILLGIITFGIYPIVVLSGISTDINFIASPYDGLKTMHYCLLCFLIAPITLGIAAFVWFHKLSARVGNELKRRGIDYSIGASDFWLWGVLGSLIVVGPYIYTYKLIKATNMLAEHYNVNG